MAHHRTHECARSYHVQCIITVFWTIVSYLKAILIFSNAFRLACYSLCINNASNWLSEHIKLFPTFSLRFLLCRKATMLHVRRKNMIIIPFFSTWSWARKIYVESQYVAPRTSHTYFLRGNACSHNTVERNKIGWNEWMS